MNTIDTPLGPMRLAARDGRLAGLWFRGQKHEPAPMPTDEPAPDLLRQVERWLEAYFSGDAAPLPALAPAGTAFQQRVWDALLRIPAGSTLSYGELAAAIGSPRSTRAAAAAVGRNPISLMIPCHRVVGANGQLTGYAGGVGRKHALLELEARRKLPRQRVVAAYRPQYPDPIAVEVGECVRFVDRADDGEFPGWKWSLASDGRGGWVPREWFREAPAGATATRAYSARELPVQPGDRVIAAEHFGGWALAIREDGSSGWIPLSAVAVDAVCQPTSTDATAPRR
jgi:methylated-DNA-[protein]-cysteine S-methyltransferase